MYIDPPVPREVNPVKWWDPNASQDDTDRMDILCRNEPPKMDFNQTGVKEEGPLNSHHLTAKSQAMTVGRGWNAWILFLKL